MRDANFNLATKLDMYLLNNRTRWYDRNKEIGPAPIPWLDEIKETLQDPEVFCPIMVMLDDSRAIEDSVERDQFIHHHLEQGYKAMLETGHWIYNCPASA